MSEAVVGVVGCWYGSRGWTFPPIFHSVLLPCDRWQQRGSLTKWRLTWKCIWSKGVELNSSLRKKWHLLTFSDACWMCMETKQWMWAQWGVGDAFQQWRQRQCIPSASADFDKHATTCSLMVKMHSWWWWLCWKIVFSSWEFALSNSVIGLFVSVVISMEINRRHYFRSDLHTSK